MAKDESTDILMMFMQNSGKPLPASSQTKISSKAANDPNSLVYDFEAGCYFEIDNIDLDVSAPSSDDQTVGKSRQGVQIRDITITRQIDRASMVLMQACIDAQDFAGASIVKRRAVGGGSESGHAYLRIDFDGVLIIKVDWSDEHVVKETITFITRGVTVQYRPQKPDGSLDTVAQAAWTMAS